MKKVDELKRYKELEEKNPKIKKALEPKWNKYLKGQVITAKQRVLMCADAYKYILFGGAAGGGKSYGLILCALQWADYPNYSALLLRRTITELEQAGGLMDIAFDILQPFREKGDIKWKEQKKTWIFPNNSTIKFGFLDGKRDHLNYKGGEYNFIGADEGTDLRFNQIMYLHSRMRKSKDSVIPLRSIITANPGGRSHEELKKRYITSPQDKYIFIPAGLNDNPHLDTEEYAKTLSDLDPVTKRQLLNGDWDIQQQGNFFDRENFHRDKYPIKDFKKTIRFWDLAATEVSKDNTDPDWTAGVKMAIDEENRIWILDVRRFRKRASIVEQEIKYVAEIDGQKCEQYIEQEPGSAGKALVKHYQNDVLPDHVTGKLKTSGDKVTYAKIFSSAVDRGNVFLYPKKAWHHDYLDEHQIYPNDDVHDDQVDASSKGYYVLTNKKKNFGVWGSEYTKKG